MPSNSTPRILQQQPERAGNQEQQQSGSNDFQPKPEAKKQGQQMGEGSYEGSRDYQRRTEDYLKKADVDAVKPRHAHPVVPAAEPAPPGWMRRLWQRLNSPPRKEEDERQTADG